MKDLLLRQEFYKDKKVLVTGHTGFKGAWLTLWLTMLGARVTGVALKPEPGCLYERMGGFSQINNIYEDICNLDALTNVIKAVKPDIIIHLAAFSFIKEAQRDPVRAFTTNLLGSVNLLEAVRQNHGVPAVVMVTTDKVYRNKGLKCGYTEADELGGGLEVYSGSKACIELAIESYRNAYFQLERYEEHRTAIATARASNVLGGGDHIKSRLVPGILDSLSRNEEIIIRNPNAIRPWQNILDALRGYLTLAQNLYTYGTEFSGAWNFGPANAEIQTVEMLVKGFIKSWGGEASYSVTEDNSFREASVLLLDITKSTGSLGWKPIRSLQQTIDETVEFYKCSMKGEAVKSLCQKQIESYMKDLF